MEPTSPLLLVLLAIGAIGGLVALARYRHVAIRLACGSLALTLAVIAGIAFVNDYYGYYTSWSQLTTDLNGDYDPFPTAAVATGATTAAGMPATSTGRIESIRLAGPASGISRPALVYLPPQYFEPQYAEARFPVLELFHGSPGTPSAWVVHLDIAKIASQLLQQHLIGPMIIVMPTINAGHQIQDCVDVPGALDDTYLTRDVRTDIEAHFRATTDPAEWGIGGYSSGGYCAANLALRHPADFGASAVMDGYFRPQDGPAAQALHFDPTAEAANDPLTAAALAGRGGAPLPSFWMSVGTGDSGDVAGADAFTAALHGVEAIPVYRITGVGHSFYAWEPAEPYLLQWMWTQIAAPALRVQFPIAGPVTSTSVTLSPATLAAAHHPSPTPSPDSIPTVPAAGKP